MAHIVYMCLLPADKGEAKPGGNQSLPPILGSLVAVGESGSSSSSGPGSALSPVAAAVASWF